MRLFCSFQDRGRLYMVSIPSILFPKLAVRYRFISTRIYEHITQVVGYIETDDLLDLLIERDAFDKEFTSSQW